MEKKNSISITGKLNLSQAQQILLLSVLASSIVLGVGIALSLNFINQIKFNAKVIMEKDQAIVSYSTAISKIGVCRSPKGDTYSEDELRNCTPSTIDVKNIPGTLRYNIVNGLAVNPALNSVPKGEVDLRCVSPDTLQNYTLKELNKMYIDAETVEDRESATTLLKTCSALRTIPDALPASENQEAMLSSLNKIFNISGWIPESLVPIKDSEFSDKSGINGYGVNIAVDADLLTVQELLHNIERSIRNIDVTSASISYGGESSLKLTIGAQAYYVDKTMLSETSKTVKPDSAKGDSSK